MELRPISKLHFLNLAGETIEGPQEWTPALIELRVPLQLWEDASIYLQERALPIRVTRIAGLNRILAEWPLSSPGHYELSASWPGDAERRTVTVRPSKISHACFEQLLDDLESDLPASVAIALQRMGALAGVEILPPGTSTYAQEILRLRRAIDGTTTRAGLVTVLADIGRRPHEILRTNESWVRTSTARRPHPARLPAAICRGDNYTDAGQLRRLLDTRVEHTFDVYENRLVKGFTSQVERRLRVLSRLVTKKCPDSPEMAVLQGLEFKLRQAKRQAAFLREVCEVRHVQLQTTMVLLNRPSYRSALQGYLEFNKAVAVRFEDPRLESPLDNLPALYQRWGTMMVIHTLLEVGQELGYRLLSQNFVKRDFEGLCVRILPDGRPVVEFVHDLTGNHVKLIPERSYGSAGELRSISFTQRPDIAIEVRPTPGPVRVYLFDPKYKLRSEQGFGLTEFEDSDVPQGMPKKVDIDKMHSYRDAIRDEQLSRVVRYAAILYPGTDIVYADDIEALQAYPGQTLALQQRLRTVLLKALSPA